MGIKRRIKEYAVSMGIDLVGFGSTRYISFDSNAVHVSGKRIPPLRKVKKKHIACEENDPLNFAKSFVSIALPYDSPASPKETVPPNNFYSVIPEHARVRDFRFVVNRNN